MKLAWLRAQFALWALAIARAGDLLSRSADQLAGPYGWAAAGSAWRW
jgi:hypothetical protein